MVAPLVELAVRRAGAGAGVRVAAGVQELQQRGHPRRVVVRERDRVRPGLVGWAPDDGGEVRELQDRGFVRVEFDAVVADRERDDRAREVAVDGGGQLGNRKRTAGSGGLREAADAAGVGERRDGARCVRKGEAFVASALRQGTELPEDGLEPVKRPAPVPARQSARTRMSPNNALTICRRSPASEAASRVVLPPRFRGPRRSRRRYRPRTDRRFLHARYA